MTSVELARALAELEPVNREEIPGLLAALEKARAELWARLTAPSPSTPTPTSERKAEEPLLTVEQAAKHLGVSRWWIYDHKAEVPRVMIGKRGYRFSRASLDRWRRGRELR